MENKHHCVIVHNPCFHVCMLSGINMVYLWADGAKIHMMLNEWTLQLIYLRSWVTQQWMGTAHSSAEASIARTPATCLEAWSGDHCQTTGGLQQNKESKAFRRKLINRPLALRGQTKYIQAHELGGIAQRYLDCLEGTLPFFSRLRGIH